MPDLTTIEKGNLINLIVTITFINISLSQERKSNNCGQFKLNKKKSHINL